MPLPVRWPLLGLALCSLGAAVVFAGDPPPAPVNKDEAEGLIFERQQIMTKLDEDTEALGEIVSGGLPKDKLGVTTRAIADGAREALAAFKAQAPGGRSKAEVWANHPEFLKRLEAFATSTEAMAKLGEAGNLIGVTEQLITALPCKECHDVYREPKKSPPAATQP